MAAARSSHRAACDIQVPGIRAPSQSRRSRRCMSKAIGIHWVVVRRTGACGPAARQRLVGELEGAHSAWPPAGARQQLARAGVLGFMHGVRSMNQCRGS